MSRDLSQDNSNCVETNVCIIGSGIAGISLALRLKDSGLRILVLESGDRCETVAAQSLNKGESNDANYPFEGSRRRMFGGTSSRWYGACIELDPMDFSRRDWLSYSGWPIASQTLAKYYAMARDVFGLPSLDEAQKQVETTPFHGNELVAKAVGHAEITDLGAAYWQVLSKAHNINVMLDSTVTELLPTDDLDRIGKIKVSRRSGERFSVTADHVVIACGGIENARLLLASNSAWPNGIGNMNDTVGRYHMEHPMRSVGLLPVGKLAQTLHLFTHRKSIGGANILGTVGLAPAVRNRERLLDMHLRAYRYNPLEAEPAIIKGKSALRNITAAEKSVRKGALRDIMQATSVSSIQYFAWHGANKLSRHAKFDHLRFTAFLEQEPDPDNRITLSASRDMFGRLLPRLTYRQSAFMKASCRRTLEILSTAFEKNGFGRLNFDESSISHLAVYDQYGLHQMGATRMSEDPRTGVVDQDCKVHGLRNLFVAGSSVFPTGGAANPSLTISALALRLADHLAGLFSCVYPSVSEHQQLVASENLPGGKRP